MISRLPVIGAGRAKNSPQTVSSFSAALEKEYKSLNEDPTGEVIRQFWGKIKIVKRSRLTKWFLKLHKKIGHHDWEQWQHYPAGQDWYEECESCGTSIKHEGAKEHWDRRCATCGKYERADTKPKDAPEVEDFVGNQFTIPFLQGIKVDEDGSLRKE